MILKILGAFIAIFSFSLLIEIPRKYLFLAGIVGAVGGIAFVACTDLLQMGTVLASFWSAFTVALLSHSFARIFKAPVTLFLIAGILPTVPGAGMYRIVYSMALEDTAMAGYYLVQTLEIAGVIALAIFLMDSVFRVFQKGWKQNSLKY